MNFLLLPLVSCLLFSGLAFANPNEGTIAHVKGTVQVLRKPQKNSGNRKHEVLYEELFYELDQVKIGAKIRKGEVLQTGTDGRAKVIFPNGDHLMIGPGTSYRMLWDEGKGKADKESVLNLFYGKMRALVSKNGPRNKMEVKTPSAVAGVRGTDFFVSYAGDKGTEVSVLRGAVEVAPTANPVKVEVVKTGFIALVTPEPKTVKSPRQEISVKESSKEKLLEIQAVSAAATSADLTKLSEPLQKEIQSLEKKAVQATVEDIKISHPDLLKTMKPEEAKDLATLNTAVVSDLYKKAPAEKIKKKPSLDDLEGIDKDVYKKYFEKNGP